MMINKIDNKTAFRGVFKTNDDQVVAELKELDNILGFDEKGIRNTFLLNSHNVKSKFHSSNINIPDNQHFFIFNDFENNDTANFLESAEELKSINYDNFEKFGEKEARKIYIRNSQELVDEYMKKAKDITLEQAKSIVNKVRNFAKESLSKLL